MRFTLPSVNEKRVRRLMEEDVGVKLPCITLLYAGLPSSEKGAPSLPLPHHQNLLELLINLYNNTNNW